MDEWKEVESEGSDGVVFKRHKLRLIEDILDPKEKDWALVVSRGFYQGEPVEEMKWIWYLELPDGVPVSISSRDQEGCDDIEEAKKAAIEAVTKLMKAGLRDWPIIVANLP